MLDFHIFTTWAPGGLPAGAAHAGAREREDGQADQVRAAGAPLMRRSEKGRFGVGGGGLGKFLPKYTAGEMGR